MKHARSVAQVRKLLVEVHGEFRNYSQAIQGLTLCTLTALWLLSLPLERRRNALKFHNKHVENMLRDLKVDINDEPAEPGI